MLRTIHSDKLNLPIACGVISYLGPCQNQNDRIKNHIRQVEWINQNLDFLDTYRVEQCYPENPELKLNRCKSINSPKITPGKARNMLLDILYESDLDGMILMDDDSVLSISNLDIDTILQAMQYLGKDGNIVLGMATFLQPKSGYSSRLCHELPNCVLATPAVISGSMPIAYIPNFRKLGLPCLKFDPDTTARGSEINEDLAFLIDCLREGIGVYSLPQASTVCLDRVQASSIYDSMEDRRSSQFSRTRTAIDYFKNRFPEFYDVDIRGAIGLREVLGVVNSAIPQLLDLDELLEDIF